MASIERHIKEAKKLAEEIKDYPAEDKAVFLQAQVDSMEKQLYRYTVDIEIAKKYIKHGEDINEESFINTGEQKIQETVQAMRGLSLALAKNRQLLADVQK